MRAIELVMIFCKSCKKESKSRLAVKGLDDSLEVVYYTECPKCDNWESGDIPFQGFDILEYLNQGFVD